MKDRTNFRLKDIIDAIDQIHALLKNKTYQDLTADKVVKAAFERFLERRHLNKCLGLAQSLVHS